MSLELIQSWNLLSAQQSFVAVVVCADVAATSAHIKPMTHSHRLEFRLSLPRSRRTNGPYRPLKTSTGPPIVHPTSLTQAPIHFLLVTTQKAYSGKKKTVSLKHTHRLNMQSSLPAACTLQYSNNDTLNTML